jgi:hypothetical protein
VLHHGDHPEASLIKTSWYASNISHQLAASLGKNWFCCANSLVHEPQVGCDSCKATLSVCIHADHKLMYSFLDALIASFSDGDVRLMLLVLQTIGQQLRTVEPTSLKTFIEGVEAKMAALAAAYALSQRSRLMLELILEMKNAKKIKEKHGAGSLESNLNADVMVQLRNCSADRVALHSISWEQVCLQPL